MHACMYIYIHIYMYVQMRANTQEQPNYIRVCKSRRRRMRESICGWVQVQLQAQVLGYMQMWVQV